MYHSSQPHTIQKMFSTIADRYDRANLVFSFGLNKYWNRRLVGTALHATHLLDLCAGTGEIGLGFLKRTQQTRTTLLDFCPAMLRVARAKSGAERSRCRFLQADAQKIPLKAESVDAVTVAYGIRNVSSTEACFKEVLRVLRPKGTFAILELTRPKNKLLRYGHQIYLHTALPVLGKLIAKNKEAYEYLSRSIEGFVSPEVLEECALRVGFAPQKRVQLSGGIATLLIFKKL